MTTSSILSAAARLVCAAFLVCASARAAELFYTGGTWHTGTTAGPVVAGPTDTDAAHIIDGGIDIPAGQTFTTALSGNIIPVMQNANRTGAAGSIGALAGSSGTVTVAGYWNNKSHLLVGGLGAGVLNIDSGTVNVAGQVFIGRTTGASGSVSINGGLMQAAGWVFVGGAHPNDVIDVAGANAGDGYLYIAQGGTLANSVNGMRVAYGNVESTGTVVVDGVLKNTGYIQIGHWGKGALTIGQTGTVTASTYIDIGGGDGATPAYATGTIAGYASTVTYFRVANARSVATLDVTPSGTIIVGTDSAIGFSTTSTGAANVAGYWKTTSNFYVGNNGGKGVLDISGTVVSGNMHVGQSAASVEIATSYATSGTVLVRDGGYLQTAYLQVGQWGQGYLEIEQGAYARSTEYFITGGGDDTRAGYTAYGYAKVAGQIDVNAFVSVGNQNDSIGVLDVTETGVVRIGTVFFIGRYAGSGANLASTGTANIAGRLSAASAAISEGGGNSTLNILPTGSVSFTGNYTQRAAGVLGITLDSARTTPYLEIGGIAALNGTLNVIGTASTISDSITKASQISSDGPVLIHATGGFSGDFATINNIVGGSALPSYIVFTSFIDHDTDFRVGYALAGTIDLAAGETFEIDVPLRDVPASPTWDGKSLIKTGAGTLVYSATTTRHTGVTLVEDGILQITSPAALTAFRGDLINNSIIDLTASADDGPRTLRAARIFGNGAFLMAVNTATHVADQLEITGDPSLLLPATIAGSHQLLLTDTRADGATPTDADIAALTLVRLSDPATAINNATLIANPDWGDGSVVYPVRFAPDGAGSLGAAAPSTASEAALAITAAQNLMWAGQQDNLARRLGDLRAQPASTGLWARAYASSVTLDPADTGDVRLDLYGLTVGADFSWKALNGALHAGLYAGYGRSTQDFATTAEGESTLYAGGLYAAWLHDAGWFANATLGYARLQNEFTATDAYGLTTADHNNTALALSLESGRRFASARGWFAEPSAQFSLTRLDQSDYTTTGAHALPVSATAATIYRARLGALFGRTLALTNGSTLQLHARLGGLCEGSTGGETAIGALTRRPNLDGPRAEAGLGLLWRQSAATQFYFDYDAALGQNYNQPWLLSLGLRHAF